MSFFTSSAALCFFGDLVVELALGRLVVGVAVDEAAAAFDADGAATPDVDGVVVGVVDVTAEGAEELGVVPGSFDAHPVTMNISAAHAAGPRSERRGTNFGLVMGSISFLGRMGLHVRAR